MVLQNNEIVVPPNTFIFTFHSMSSLLLSVDAAIVKVKEEGELPIHYEVEEEEKTGLYKLWVYTKGNNNEQI